MWKLYAMIPYRQNCLLNDQMSCLMSVVDSLSKKSGCNNSMLSSGVSGTLEHAQKCHKNGCQVDKELHTM
jgi:hypothetical protein